MFHKRTWAEIDMIKAKKNLEIIRECCRGTKVAAVIKADGYGHGDAHLMKLYEELSVEFFAVSSLDEAIRLRDAGCTKEILILGFTPSEYADELIRYDIIQALISHEHFLDMEKNITAGKLRVHIKVDTGMGRIGFIPNDFDSFYKEISTIKSTEKFSVEGIFSHFSVADENSEVSQKFTENQSNIFFETIEKLEKNGIHFKEKHILNSAGSISHFDSRNTIARAGILLYGLKPDIEMEIPNGISPIMSLKSVISHIKTIKSGDSVSYGRTFIAEKDMKIATVQVGYADGYPRLLSGINSVKIGESYAKGVGRICMDQMMIDVTEIDNVSVGDEVLLFGDDEILTADNLAKSYGSIGYEVVCGINKRVPRIYND